MEKKARSGRFLMGVDCFDGVYSYCLFDKKDSSVLKTNTLRDKNKFMEEVEIISTYFNAKLVEEL